MVTSAVLIHDLSEGIDTSSMVLKSHGDHDGAIRSLWADALAPDIGIASTTAFALPTGDLGIVLAVLSGFFLYMGASDLIPESIHGHPKFLTTFMTLAGAAVLYLAIILASP